MLLAFERAEREPDAAKRQALLTFVVIGGGPTGVELAGALAEISRQSLARDFRHFDPSSARIILLEGGPSVLAAFPETLRGGGRTRSRTARRRSAHRNAGHRRRAWRRVETADEPSTAATVLWAAGVAASPLGATLGVPLDRAGRVHGPAGPDDPRPSGGLRHRRPRLAGRRQRQAAAGRRAGRDPDGQARGSRNIRRALERQPLRPFHYRDLGNMATIGRASAIADFGWLRLKGWIAWLAWLFVHILNLIGFRNRLVVMVQWAWAYFSYQRAIRLITGTRTGSRRRRRPAREDARVALAGAVWRARAVARLQTSNGGIRAASIRGSSAFSRPRSNLSSDRAARHRGRAR